ncbi:hypothetical protein [Tahibacter amnicola]|uniref:Uncharacterized protein n=1 Tax=Tahibacter amnicola TaxID=2976241 RepID=A0ABY6BAD8_9GAMM|nr:hypothetical protein [Tahibacter amnicola]UXI66824.1 hypothetical protein N4264_19000 [Tahibacter amnicola]
MRAVAAPPARCPDNTRPADRYHGRLAHRKLTMARHRLAPALLTCLMATALLPLAAAAADLPLKNGDFELPAGEKGVPEWLTIVHAGPPSYVMSLTKDEPGAGKQSARIERTHVNAFGSLKQTVDVPDMVGKKVELAGLLKTQGVGDAGAVLSMTFLAGSRIISQHRTELRKGDSAWAPVKVVAEVPLGTNKISVAAMLIDGGSVWFDNITLRTVEGPAKPTARDKVRPNKPKAPAGHPPKTAVN